MAKDLPIFPLPKFSHYSVTVYYCILLYIIVYYCILLYIIVSVIITPRVRMHTRGKAIVL